MPSAVIFLAHSKHKHFEFHKINKVYVNVIIYIYIYIIRLWQRLKSNVKYYILFYIDDRLLKIPVHTINRATSLFFATRDKNTRHIKISQ